MEPAIANNNPFNMKWRDWAIAFSALASAMRQVHTHSGVYRRTILGNLKKYRDDS